MLNIREAIKQWHLSIQTRVDFMQAYMFEHSTWMIPYVTGFLEHWTKEFNATAEVTP